MRMILLLCVVLPALVRAAEKPEPIIDVHLHAISIEWFAGLMGPPPIPHCVPMTDYPVARGGNDALAAMRSRDLSCKATWSPKTDEEIMRETLAIMERRNIFGVVSGGLAGRWKEAAPDRVFKSIGTDGGPESPSPDALRSAFTNQGFKVLAEVTPQYRGVEPNDASLAPVWALAEELDVPVGIHIGTGPVGAPYLGFDGYRARLHSALVLEEVLVQRPKLRVYIMHAGWPMIDDLLAVLWAHPHVYVDVGAISWAVARPEFHAYLKRIVDAGFGKRVLFGSDQMVWPEAIELALQSIESASFLTHEQRRDILFNNAVRFLRLSPEQVAAMREGTEPAIASRRPNSR